jgi:lysophospholipid acyltransferase (LPLAT)-like uncharacterized protein
MKTHQPNLVDRLIILIVTPLIQLLGMTLRIEEAGKTEWGSKSKDAGPFLWCLWHETILMSVWHHRDLGVHVMISASRDGELITRVAQFFGYVGVRGSSSKGGQEALMEMISLMKSGKRCAITPDGPRGPRRVMKMGAVNIAAQTGCPIVPYGFSAEHFWRLTSWDKFIIPRPFSRAVFVYGEPIHVPLKNEHDEKTMKKVQVEMERVTLEAEAYFSQPKAGK